MTPAPDLGEAPPPLSATDAFPRAARAAMWPHVRRVLELEPALQDVEAIDAVKRYRVATRRLRAALRVFDGALPPKKVRDVQPELAELARAVGRVRDLDVRIGGLTAWAADRGAAAREHVEPLGAAWAAERGVAAAEVAERLATKRHDRLIQGLVDLVTEPADDAGKRDGRTVRDRAGSATWIAFERLRAGSSNLEGADLATLHAIRILAKRFRYTLEFLAPVLGADREWLVARLVRLQDHLGALNDADLASVAARTFLAGDGSALPDAQRSTIEGYAAEHEATVARLRAATPAAVEPIADDAFARHLSKAILGPAEAKPARP